MKKLCTWCAFRTSVMVGALAVLLAACGQDAPSTTEAQADAPAPRAVELIIRDGLLVDGSGGATATGSVVIDAGQIVAVGDIDPAAWLADRTIEAAGRVIAPGFIDPHAHGDPLATPDFENFLAMGVTTITLGQDGSSPDVEDLRAWMDEVAAQGIGPNLAMFIGHGTLRSQSGIGRDANPDPAALEDMLARLDEAMDYTFGLSTGLEYNPGLHAPASELQAMAEVVGRHDRVVMSHMRNEDDDALAASLDELIRQGEHARVQVAHLKSVYGKGAERGEEILAMLDAARAQGVRISADVYPYTASYTGLALLFPVWAKTVEQFEQARVERRDELADYLRNRVNQRNGPEATLLGTAPHDGKTLAQLATELGKPFEDVLIDDLGPDGGSAAYFIMDDELQMTLLADPSIAICSDGSPTGFHPRGHGTFARIIEEYVGERALFSLPEAVRKMTSLPASQLGIGDRGRLAPGLRADVIVFDPQAVVETATYAQPHQLAEGFDVVIVNGRIARQDGALDAALHGEVLTP